MYYLILACYIIILFLNISLNDLSFSDSGYLLLSFILNFYYLKKYPVTRNLGKYAIYIPFFISVVVMPAFRCVVNIHGFVDITQIDYERIASFGVKVYFISSIAFGVFARLFRPINKFEYRYKPYSIKNQLVDIFFVVIYLMSIFAYSIGLGKMGSEAVELPFHLGGIINLFRMKVAPIIFALIVENYLLRGKSFSKKYYVLYLVWMFIEILAWTSKGVLINYSIPTLLVLFFYYRPSIRTVLKIMVPLLSVFILIYPIVGALRNIDEKGSLVSKISEANTISKEQSIDANNPVLQIVNRIFMTSFMYAEDYELISSDKLFDMSLAPLVVLYGGAEGFQTYYVDGFDEDVNHSSGTTGLIDPLLHGGYGFCYIIIVFLLLLGAILDRSIVKRKYGLYSQFVFFLWGLSTTSNVSMLYNPVGLQYNIAFLFSVFLIYRVNFYHKEVICKK